MQQSSLKFRPVVLAVDHPTTELKLFKMSRYLRSLRQGLEDSILPVNKSFRGLCVLNNKKRFVVLAVDHPTEAWNEPKLKVR